MIKIGRHYYKNVWTFIQVVVFRKPNIYLPKKQEYNYNPFDEEEITAQDFESDNFHEECGDR